MDNSEQKTIPKNFPVLLLAGLSGAGKSSLLYILNDIKYFTVDGLPPELLSNILQTLNKESLEKQGYIGLVLGIDLRNQNACLTLLQAIKDLQSLNVNLYILYMESTDAVIMRRYATTRRPHPLENEGFCLASAIKEERQRTKPLKEFADYIVDTSNYSIHDLRRFIQNKWSFVSKEHEHSFKINIISFGFKYGIPADLDMMFDLRFLPNPYFEAELKNLTGKDAPVIDYIFSYSTGQTFYDKLESFISYLLPLYEQEGRYRLSIGIGCTGGQHRSVAISEKLFATLSTLTYSVRLEHRHIDLERKL